MSQLFSSLSQRFSFRQQLSLIFVIGIFVLAMTTSIIVSKTSSDILHEEYVKQGVKVTEAIASRSELALLYQSKHSAEILVADALKFPGIKGVGVFSDTGDLLYSEAVEGAPSIEKYETNTPALAGETNNCWTFSSPVVTSKSEETPWSDLDANHHNEQQVLGTVTVVYGKETLKLLEQNVLKRNLVVSFCVAMVLLLLLMLLSRRLTSPLENLAKTMKQAEKGDSSVRANIRGTKEVVEIRDSFNTMMSALETRQSELACAMSAAVESARAKTEFAANVTHELRTPMNAVLGMLELLSTMDLGVKQREYVETAKLSGENLLELIEEVLSFSEMDTETLSLDNEEFSLNVLLDDVMNLLANQALKKDIDLGYFIEDSQIAFIYGDALRLRQVLINLIGNAIKFTDVGEVAVRVSFDFIEQDCDDKSLVDVTIRVIDTGIGISQEDQPTIFDAFIQLDSSNTKAYSGTGLGLSIARQIISLMDGTLTVDSQLGMGSCFTARFTTEFTKLYCEKVAGLPGLAGVSAYVLDDSAIVRDYLAQQFENAGIECEAFDGRVDLLRAVNELSANNQQLSMLLIDEDLLSFVGDDLNQLCKNNSAMADCMLFVLANPWSELGFVLDSHAVKRINKPVRYAEIKRCISEYQGRLLPAASSNAEISAKNMPQFTGLHVLVVDDNKANQQVAKGMLERFECQVTLAANGKEAVEAVIRESYDLVLMDCNMPVVNGYDATRQIRAYENVNAYSDENKTGDVAQEPVVSIPIVAMTANTSKEIQQRCMDVGMSGFMTKPLSLDKLGDLLKRWAPTEVRSEQSGVSLLSAGVGSSASDHWDDDQSDTFGNRDCSYDISVLQKLRDSVGDAVLSSMIDAFLEDTPVYLRELRNALTKADGQQVAEIAHTVKGSASHFGAADLVNSCLLLEEQANEDSIDSLTNEFDELLYYYGRLASDLRAYTSSCLVKIKPAEQYEILIVDDDRATRLAMKNSLADEAYQVHEASSGNEAIQICRRHMPDLILMDVIMPDVDGFQACEQLRQLPHGAEVPILMITSLDNEDAISQGFASGATDYITKPIHYGLMRQRVKRLIDTNKVEQHVQRLTYHDQLTGLPNRLRLMQQLQQVLSRAGQEGEMVAVLFLDLDRFKLVNDTLGHDTGDLLLKAVAERIKRCVRGQDFVARLSGDEFTVILDNISDRDIVGKVAAKICDVLSQPFTFLQQKMFVSSSIGISLFPEHGGDMVSLMKHADSAMFRAKEERNGYCFYVEGMEDEMVRRMELEQELRQAIEEDQFVLHFQPQVDVQSGEVVCAEALIRWNHPKQGFLSPDTFIPLAEDAGIINEITDWVISAVCRQIQLWSAAGHPLKLAINMSSKDFQVQDFNEKLKYIIEKFDISPRFLELEITESVLMENPTELDEKVSGLRSMGVTFAIDDFGSGFSSLNYLKQMPVDILKIDREFVRDIESDPNDKAIVAGIVSLASSMNLHVVAEGVENQAQFDLLRDLGCDTCQGYFFSEPLPVEEFEAAIFKDGGKRLLN